MLTLPLGAGREATRAVVCEMAVVCDEELFVDAGLVVALGKAEPPELELVAAPLPAEPSMPAVPLCIGIAAAAATAVAAAAITTTTNQTVLTLIPPRRFLSRRLSRRVSPVWTRADCEYFSFGSPIMATMLTQAASRAKVRLVSSSVSGQSDVEDGE